MHFGNICLFTLLYHQCVALHSFCVEMSISDQPPSNGTHDTASCGDASYAGENVDQRSASQQAARTTSQLRRRKLCWRGRKKGERQPVRRTRDSRTHKGKARVSQGGGWEEKKLACSVSAETSARVRCRASRSEDSERAPKASDVDMLLLERY